MNPTADYRNIYLSTEKFIFDRLVDFDWNLSVNIDDVADRLKEITDAEKTILWHLPNMNVADKCDGVLRVGVSLIGDYGNMKMLDGLSKINFLLATACSIPVYDYTNVAKNEAPVTQINSLVIMKPVQWLPLVTEPNDYKTRLLSVRLKYAQILD